MKASVKAVCAVIIACFVVVLWTNSVHAEDASTEIATPVTTAPAVPAAPADAVPAPTSTSGLGEQLEDAKSAYDRLKRDQVTPKKFLVAALIAAIANVLLTLLKKTTKMTQRGKKYLPWIATGLGLVVGVSSYYAMGTALVDAILYGGGASGAVLLQELSNLFKKNGVENGAPAKA